MDLSTRDVFIVPSLVESQVALIRKKKAESVSINSGEQTAKQRVS